MKLVCARFHLQIHVRAGVPAVLGCVVSALYFKLLKRIDDGVQRDVVAPIIPIVMPSMFTCIQESRAPFAMMREPSVLSGELRRFVDADTGRQHGQLDETAPIQGQIDDAFSTDHLAESRVLGLQQRRWAVISTVC